jgi:hypothetical protein
LKGGVKISQSSAQLETDLLGGWTPSWDLGQVVHDVLSGHSFAGARFSTENTCFVFIQNVKKASESVLLFLETNSKLLWSFGSHD